MSDQALPLLSDDGMVSSQVTAVPQCTPTPNSSVLMHRIHNISFVDIENIENLSGAQGDAQNGTVNPSNPDNNSNGSDNDAPKKYQAIEGFLAVCGCCSVSFTWSF